MSKDTTFTFRLDDETVAAIETLALPGENQSGTIRRVLKEACEAKTRSKALSKAEGQKLFFAKVEELNALLKTLQSEGKL